MSQILKEMQVYRCVADQTPLNRRQRRAEVAMQRKAELARYQSEIAKKCMYRIVDNVWNNYVSTKNAEVNQKNLDFLNALEELFTVNFLIKLWIVMNHDVKFEGLYCNLPDLIAMRENQPVFWPELYGSLSDMPSNVDQFLTTMVRMMVVHRNIRTYFELKCHRLIKTLGDILDYDLMTIFHQKLANANSSNEQYDGYNGYSNDFFDYQMCCDSKDFHQVMKKADEAAKRRFAAFYDSDDDDYY